MANSGTALARRLKKASRLVETNAFADAAAAYVKILAEVPEHHEARYKLAVVHAMVGKHDQAVEGFRALIAALPDVAAAHADLATALEAHRIGRFAPGIALRPISDLQPHIDSYAAAMRAIPLLRACHTSIGEVLGKSGRQFEANLARAKAEACAPDLQDVLLDISATMAFPGDLRGASALHRRAVAEVPDQWAMSEQEYLTSELTFADDEILTPDGLEVMMEWERPIMERSAEIVCHNQGDVLNVGFGMAIIDSAIQRCGVTRHTIIEAHPQVVSRAEAWSQDKTGVTIVPSTWQDALASLKPFDGIYFDTLIPPILPFLRHAPTILKPQGVFSFFQYAIHFEHLVTMVRDDLEFGIEDLEFDEIPQNTYYRLNEKNAAGRYTAPLFLFRKRG